MSDQKKQADAPLEFGDSRYKFQLSAGRGREINLTVTPRENNDDTIHHPDPGINAPDDDRQGN